ncbi:MAG TPA: DUF3885 domain-containing protein [Hymenobacter sp.]
MRLHYHGLRLRRPLFYGWPIGIRFDLQADFSTDRDTYFQEVIRRAVLLFHDIFQPEDAVLVVHQQWKGKRFRIRRSSYLFRQLNLPKAALIFQKIANPYPKIFQPGRWNRVCASTTVAAIPYANIFRAISYQNSPPRKPVVYGDIYFLNQRTGVIFNMYDDRGIDIIAPNPEVLRSIYERQYDLILDYDRQQIEDVFR